MEIMTDFTIENTSEPEDTAIETVPKWNKDLKKWKSLNEQHQWTVTQLQAAYMHITWVPERGQTEKIF